MTEQPGPPADPTPPPPPPPAASPAGVPATAGTAQPLVPGAGPPQPAYPVQVDIGYQEEYSRFMPLFKGLLAIPHWIALVFVWIGALFALVAAWFAVLFTGKYPPGIFNFVVGVMRWTARVNAYTNFQTDRYPPFSLEDDPDFPARLVVEYPDAGIARWRPLLHGLLVIPYSICTGAILLIAWMCAAIAFFAILFTKTYPRGLFDAVTIGQRWWARDLAFRYWMTEQYPPFVWA